MTLRPRLPGNLLPPSESLAFDGFGPLVVCSVLLVVSLLVYLWFRAQVVGWPPVRNFRRNALKTCTYVKVAVDGAPYLRKVDLETYGGYEQLLASLQDMFSCFTIRMSIELDLLLI